MGVSDRLKHARKLAGYTSARAAALAMGVPYDTYAQHENGTQGRGVPREAIVRYAKFFRVTLDWLLAGRGAPKGNRHESVLIGKVGAGAEVTRFDTPDVLEGIAVAEDLGAPNAVRIEGDSQYPLQPGWVIFYGPENNGVPDNVIGKLCVVQVKDGPILLKTLKRGSKRGLWRLESWNAPPREDVKVEWAAMVKAIRPT